MPDRRELYRSPSSCAVGMGRNNKHCAPDRNAGGGATLCLDSLHLFRPSGCGCRAVFGEPPLASVRWNSTIRPSRHLREMFHGIRPDCGGDGTRVVCGGTAHHWTRERRDMSVWGDSKNNPRSQAGGFSISMCNLNAIAAKTTLCPQSGHGAEWPRWFSRSRLWSRRFCSGCLWPRLFFRLWRRLDSAPTN